MNSVTPITPTYIQSQISKGKKYILVLKKLQNIELREVSIMRVSFLLFFTLLGWQTIFSQTQKEAETWIAETINTYAYTEGSRIINNYKITYEDGNMIIEGVCYYKYDVNTSADTLYAKAIIPIKELNKIRFEEQKFNIWLYLRTKRDTAISIIDDDGAIGKQSNYEILLTKGVKNDNLMEKLSKAFNVLINSYRGNADK